MRALGLVIGYLLAMGSVSEVWGQARDGEALYRQHCGVCHGERGVPAPNMRTVFKDLPNLADSAFLATRSQDAIVAVLNDGLRGMPPFKGRLNAAEMVAVASYLRTLATATTGAHR